MEIDAKVVGVSVWKIVRFSTKTTCRYVRKYPVVSGVSTFLFLLYVFLPAVFHFLLCSSPLIAFAAFYLRNHLILDPPKIRDSSKEKKTDKGSSSPVQKGSVSGDGRNLKAYLKPQRSVRRNVRRKVEEVGKGWDSLHGSEDETDRVILTTLFGELPSPTAPDFERFKKDKTLRDSEESLFNHVVDSSSSSSSKTENVVLDSSEKEMESSSSSEEEEESHEETNKAVAWTSDDQKNLMDLGTSEIERNKRLENLIARRRARRLFLLAAERSLRGMRIPQICVERNYFDLDKEYFNIDDELQIPGSAPSVLLPTRNPFDLPYDPQEEKPNLSGDSFLQEFEAVNQKDMFFCRHESFCRGVFPSENQHGSKLEPWRKAIDGHRFYKFRPPQDGGNNDGLVEQQQSLTKESDLTTTEGNNIESGSGHTSEVQTGTGSIRNDDYDSGHIGNSASQTNSKTFCKRNGDHIGNALMGLVPRNNVSSSLGAERQRYMEHFGYSTRTSHMVTHSVDSDLQVEVSEIGSPPTTVDEIDYSDDDKSPFLCESEVGREMGSCGEDTSANSEPLPVEKVDPDFTKLTLSFSPENNVTENFKGPSDVSDANGRSLEDDRPKPREFQSQSTSDRSNVTPLEISDRESQIVEEPMAAYPDEVVSNEIDESLNPSDNLADEIKISYDSDEANPSEKADQESQGQDENNEEDRPALEMQEVLLTEASDVENGNSDESAPSPRSVLPDVSSLDRAYSLRSEDLENLSVGHSRTVNAAPESLQNQSAGGRNTEEPESSFNLDSAVKSSEESEVATGMDDMEKLCHDKPESAESREEPNTVKHENFDPSEQRMARDETETIRDAQEESKTEQDLQFFVDSTAKELKNNQSTVIEERIDALNPEDEEHTLEDRSQSGKADDPKVMEKLYKDPSNYNKSGEDQVQFQTKGIIEAEESKPEKHKNMIYLSKQVIAGDESETVGDVHEESKTAEEDGSSVDLSVEELQNDQMVQMEERGRQTIRTFS
ncbi:PREDICTED: dentin sialophosphoprotein-like isoform X2 [Tarenaya hassleriana]|uniref:dentin sialophosphoprotein-like isoform X2 n=1 Tax=Tarenaya hassleriana TaxID=28532 RepID=UPI00053C49BE|nr:PREDICTED: dentin sialophosphoprotein-like isoform X2 [Tarenaya hassleriana]